MFRRLLCFLSLSIATSAPAADAPIEDLWRHAEFQEMTLSPGGEYLAATVPDDDETRIVILDIRDFPDVKLLTALRGGTSISLASPQWIGDERLVYTSLRRYGSLDFPYYTGDWMAVNADGSQKRVLHDGDWRHATFRWASVIHDLPDDKNHVLISGMAVNDRRPAVWRMHVYHENRLQRVARSPLERGGLMADQDGEVRFAYGLDDDGNPKIAWRRDGSAAWESFDNPFDGAFSFAGFVEGENSVYVGSTDEAYLGVFKLDLETGEYEKLLGDDTFAPAFPIRDAKQRSIIGARFATPIPGARFFDPEHPTARIWRSLINALPQYELIIPGFTDDGSKALVALRNDREPGVFMLLNTETMKLHELAARQRWIRPDQMAAKQPVSFTARDGLELHGYLTLPPDSDGTGLPMIVEVHGGPHGPYDAWNFHRLVQTWALSGYAVLQINFRGSGGRSYQFENDAFGQWGAEMQDDITDGTLWAIEQGIADPDRICISGASYGGYASMMGVVREPDLYRCAFAFVGVYDLELMKRRGDIPLSRFGRRFLERALGTDSEDLQQRSPVAHVDRIRADLFIAHGAEDIRAHTSQYHTLIKALENAGIRHEKLYVRGEGHGFYKPGNNVLLYGNALKFFDRNIGSGHRPRDETVVRDALEQASGGSTGE